MFMIVTYPWPVASAHVELTGPQEPDPAMSETGAGRDTINQWARHIEQMIRWTEQERLRFQWYRLRMAMNEACRRPARVSLGSPVTRDRGRQSGMN
jgi:hypothetical protein